MQKSILTKHQKKVFSKDILVDGKKGVIEVVIRYDDECGNGHNSFSITGTIWTSRRSRADRYFYTGGAIHDEIAKYFPELRKYIKWHFMNSDGPTHYIANTLYHARDRSHDGKEIGEPVKFTKKLKFGQCPILFKEPKNGFFDFIDALDLDSAKVVGIEHPTDKSFSPWYTFNDFGGGEWYKTPFMTKEEAAQWQEALKAGYSYVLEPVKWCEAVSPNLQAARNTAIWEDATLDQLQSKEALQERLPALIAEFKKVVEELGFVF